jgi:hypothetical protein
MSNERQTEPRQRTLICQCGAEFDPSRNKRPGSARYCSNACRVRFGRFGRTYGTVEPRQYGWTRS